MKTLILIGTILAVSAFYTDLDETIDFDAILADPEKIKPILNCYLDKGPCTETIAKYKSHINDILTDTCEKCDDKLKHFLEEFLLNVMTQYPEETKELRAKYDPDGVKLAKLALTVSKY